MFILKNWAIHVNSQGLEAVPIFSLDRVAVLRESG